MTVEIRELVIRAVVTDQPQTDRRESGQYGDEIDRILLIQECVREVMKQMKKAGNVNNNGFEQSL